jgi:hypothetical protein
MRMVPGRSLAMIDLYHAVLAYQPLGDFPEVSIKIGLRKIRFDG